MDMPLAPVVIARAAPHPPQPRPAFFSVTAGNWLPGMISVQLSGLISGCAVIQMLLHAEWTQRPAPAIRATIAAALLHSARAMPARLAHHWSRT